MLTLKLPAPYLTTGPTRLRRDVEKGFAVCGLLLLPASDVVWPGIIFAFFAATLLILAWNWRAVQAVVATNWPLLLPILLAAFSVLWSVEPEVSLYKMIALGGTTAFGAFLAIRFSLKEQLKVLALVLVLVACASAAVALLLPRYGVMTGSHEGAWSGIFYHKNSLGRIMALSTLVFFLLALGTKKLRLIALTGMALSIALVFASQSRASLIVAIACLTVVSILPTIPRLSRSMRTVVLLVGAIAAASTAGWAMQHADNILTFLGTDRTFTGRTQLWTALLEKARARLWFGYGYGAFWRGATGASGEVQKALNWSWYPVHGHNGFLDLVLELGIVGLLIFLLPLGFYGYRTYKWVLMQRSLLRLWPLTYLLFFILSNLAESALVRQSNIYWALYVAAILTVQLDKLDIPA